MKDKLKLCERCLIRGYSPDLCREHYKMLAKMNHEVSLPKISMKSVGRTAAIGAGVGTIATGSGLAVLSFVGIKAVVGLVMAAKICAGGGVLGAGVNMAKKSTVKQPKNKSEKKKRILIL